MNLKKIHSKLRLSHFRRKVRDKLGLRLGKKIKRKLGFGRVTSAAGVSSSDSIYGPTGSIVGRY